MQNPLPDIWSECQVAANIFLVENSANGRMAIQGWLELSEKKEIKNK